MAVVFLTEAPGYCQDARIAPYIDMAKNQVNTGHQDSAILFADSAIRLSIKWADTLSMIKALRLKGKALANLKRDKDATDLFFEGLRLCKIPRDNSEIALLDGEIGYTYFSRNNFEESKQYYEREINILRQLKGEDSIGNQWINLSVMFQQLEQYDSALLALNHVATITSRVNDSELKGYYYLNRGSLLQFMKQPDSAAYYYRQAYNTWKSAGNESQLYKVTFNLGFLAEEKKNYRDALEYYRLSEVSARKFGLQREIAHVYGTMAEAYAATGDYKNAYDYLYRYAMINDSLNRGDINNYMVKLDKQYQADRNQATIREQQVQLNAALLEVARQRNHTLSIMLALAIVILAGLILFGYFIIGNRVRREVDAAKSRFFADVVHEIRTPLSMIQAPIMALQSKVTDPEMYHQLEIASRNTHRLNELVNQMLDISKIDAARYRLQESVGDPVQFVDDVVGAFKEQADIKKLELVKTIPVGAGNLWFDRDALEKITGNLLGNAIKYTPPGGSVGVEVAIESENERVMFTLKIRDSGPGIAKEDADRIFDRFYRAASQKSGASGTGIGLSLVKDLVTLMNGALLLDSEPGNGATFTVKLPFRKAIMPGSEESAPENEEWILLVEDDADILDFNRVLLTGHGYTVITAPDGAEALRLMNEHLPSLVITDLMMPGMDGMKLLKEIRANTITDHIPVIILSAKASGHAITAGIRSGAQVYLSKPFRPDELLGLVDSQLQLLKKQIFNYRKQFEKENQTVEQRFAGPDPFTRQCYDMINIHLNDAQLSVEALADLLHVNRSHLQRKIKALTGFSPSELIRTIRLEKARELLQQKKGNITEIAYATGFTSQSYFTKCYTEEFGYSPSQEAKK